MKQPNRQHLIELLSHNVLDIIFTKKDGSERMMRCTLKEDTVPQYERSDKERSISQEVLPVWDLEKEAWRSFRIDSVKEVTFSA